MSKSQADRFKFQKAFHQWKNRPILLLSAWFGTGLSPKAPGTIGTIGAIPLAFFMNHIGPLYGFIFLVIFTFLAVWLSGKTQKIIERKDPSLVVIDEVAGYLWAVWFLPFSIYTLIFGFIFFRFFDILKPFPVNKMENLKGGWGVVLDDVLAGIFSNLCIRIILLIFPAFNLLKNFI